MISIRRQVRRMRAWNFLSVRRSALIDGRTNAVAWLQTNCSCSFVLENVEKNNSFQELAFHSVFSIRQFDLRGLASQRRWQFSNFYGFCDCSIPEELISNLLRKLTQSIYQIEKYIRLPAHKEQQQFPRRHRHFSEIQT